MRLDASHHAGRIAGVEEFFRSEFYRSIVLDVDWQSLEREFDTRGGRAMTPAELSAYCLILRGEVLRSSAHIGQVWRAFRFAVFEARRRHGGGTLPSFRTLMTPAMDSVPRIQRLVANANTQSRLANDAKDAAAKLHMWLALLQTWQQVGSFVVDGLCPRSDKPLPRGVVPPERCLFDRQEAKRWVNLEYLVGVPASLSKVRNSLAHGHAVIEEGGIALHEDKTGAVTRITIPEIQSYIRYAEATWEVFLLELTIGAAVDAAPVGIVGPSYAWSTEPS